MCRNISNAIMGEKHVLYTVNGSLAMQDARRKATSVYDSHDYASVAFNGIKS